MLFFGYSGQKDGDEDVEGPQGADTINVVILAAKELLCISMKADVKLCRQTLRENEDIEIKTAKI